MCAFEINFYSQKQEFHRYGTEDFALLDIGIGHYNRSSIANFFSINLETGQELKPLNPDIKEFFSNTTSRQLVDRFLGVNAISNMEIMAYDENEKKYKLKRGLSQITKIDTSKYKEHTEPNNDNIKTFLKEWHNVQIGIQTDPKIINGYKLIAHRIQNSMSGCITFPLTDVNILEQPRKSIIRLYILESKDSDSSKTVSFNGSPFISAIPQTAEGMRYGYTNTSNAPVGVYDKTSGDLNNPKDKVAGQMRMVWDPTTRTWESGTQQIMARLIDDIDAAIIPELTGEQLLALSQAEVYDVPPEENPIMSKSPHGRAMPLSTENGNPNLFGPNFRGGCDENAKKSIIQVVNRSPRSYKQGTLVVCSFINGEWIIVSGEGGLVESKKLLNFGRFEFQQYIIPENLYFAIPNSTEKFLPDKWVSKIRSSYYSSLPRDYNFLLNVIASSMTQEEENPLLYLADGLRNIQAGATNTFVDNKNIDGTDCMFGGFGNSFYYTRYHLPQNTVVSFNYTDTNTRYDQEQRKKVPRNALVNSNRLLALGLPGVKNGPGDPIDKFEIPLFWGMLFPDGYKAEQCKKFFDDTETGPVLKGNKIYANDPNLKELSVSNCISLPYIADEKKFLLYAKHVAMTSPTKLIVHDDLIRKSGGSFRNLGVKLRTDVNYLNDIKKLDNFLAMTQDNLDVIEGTNNPQFHNELIGPDAIGIRGNIYGLEPINPRRLQFSSMSIDFLYSQSTLNNADFKTLKSYIDFLNTAEAPAAGLPDGFKVLKDASLFYWNARYPTNSSYRDTQYQDSIFPNNTHNFKGLAFSEAFGPNLINSATINRHPPPLGVVNGGLIIPPPPTAGGYPRSPVIPVLTCRSNISTNSKALTFKTFGYFGNPQKVSILPAQGQDDVIVLPIGGGLAWQLPNTPTQVNQSPQWGDRNRTDDIDSLGTTALHIRIFESWPEYQTIYLGPIFTPLHFNPSGPKYDYDATLEKAGVGNPAQISIKDKMTDDDPPRKIEYVSEVDFKEPTRIFDGLKYNDDKELLEVGGIVDETNLAPFSDWRYNQIRRGKLLTGGGFAYVKNALFVKQVSLKTNQGGPINRGLGYKKDDQFLLPDGSKIIVDSVLEPSGQISAIKAFEPNYDLDKFIIKNPSGYIGFNSTSITPQYLGNTGNGASFDYTITVARTVGYDAPPKEVTPITRITKSSNGGENYVDGEYTTTVTMENTTKKNFDIFYFFHNDPTSYSLGVDAFNNNNAQYVISEVNPA